MRRVGDAFDGRAVLLRVNPDVARALEGEERGVLKELQQVLGPELVVRPDMQLHHEQFDMMAM
jgi:Ribonuclease G/E